MLFPDRLEIRNRVTLPSSLSLAQLKRPHGSIPFNPLLVEPMYLTGYIERFGSGTRDLYRLSKEAGLKEPEFRLTDGFTVVIWRPTTEATAEASGEAREKVGEKVREKVKKVVLVMVAEMKRPEIEKSLDLNSDDFFRVNYILPALETEYIEMTFPDSPNHPQHRYRLTAKGLELKEKLNQSQKNK